MRFQSVSILFREKWSAFADRRYSSYTTLALRSPQIPKSTHLRYRMTSIVNLISGCNYVRTNSTKAKLNDGETVFGAIISRHAPDLVEIFGAIGYDFVMIDCEHGPMNLDQVEHMVRAAEAFGITPITRIPDHADSTVLRFLDRGVQGIIVPHVNTGKEAEAIARAARYYPDGHRGVGGGRAHDYGVGISRDESTRWINAETLVIPMIEETVAVENLDSF